MDQGDRELLERSLRNATDNHTGGELDAALTELGWSDALAVDPRAAVSLLFELQGSANAASSALDRVVAHALGADAGSTAGVVLPALGGWIPPGELHGDRLRVNGIGLAALAGRDGVLVVARTGEKDVAVVVRPSDVVLRPVRGVDPWLGLVEVAGDDVEVRDAPKPVGGGWGAVVSLAHLAIGHELVGGARKMLDLARDHSLERIQFGRPIATFQAVRHRLADTLVAIETADAVLAAAWEDQSPQTAAMAKALAGRGARTAVRHCQQVLAGIGFTTEHPLHRSIRRVLVLDELFGSARELTKTLGNELLASRQLPAQLPL